MWNAHVYTSAKLYLTPRELKIPIPDSQNPTPLHDGDRGVAAQSCELRVNYHITSPYYDIDPCRVKGIKLNMYICGNSTVRNIVDFYTVLVRAIFFMAVCSVLRVDFFNTHILSPPSKSLFLYPNFYKYIYHINISTMSVRLYSLYTSVWSISVLI